MKQLLKLKDVIDFTEVDKAVEEAGKAAVELDRIIYEKGIII